MRKSALVALLAVALLLVGAVPSHAWRGHPVRTRIFIGVGPAFWWGPPFPYWWYYPPPYPPYYVYSPPPVIVQEPPVYIQPPPPAPPPPSYWYYCPSAGGYYPTVQTCPEPWLRVQPRTE